MINLSGLTKRFGPITAVDNISFSVNRGEVLGFLGPNGAGKTTTMRMLTGFLPPSAGSASVAGHDVVNDTLEAQKKIGYLPEGTPLYGDMTPAAFLEFVADVRNLKAPERQQRIDDVVAKVEIEDVFYRPIETLSKGYRRRVGLAQAILHDPEVLILDEPTDGLDPNQKHQVRSLIRNMAKDKAIVISTHILEEVEAICTRTVIIAQGKIVFDGTPGDLLAQAPTHNAVCIRVPRARAGQVKTAIESVPDVARVEHKEDSDGRTTLVVFPSRGRAIIVDVSQRLTERALAVDEIGVLQGRLDDVFRRLTLEP
ncbi:MAG: ABC transporter ATP-binding protein [Rhodospirillales bacterium]|nr:ABC transporter ATP-binding protein [Rhodospirillales bacterium]